MVPGHCQHPFEVMSESLEIQTITKERGRAIERHIDVPLLTQFLDGGPARHHRKVFPIFCLLRCCDSDFSAC